MARKILFSVLIIFSLIACNSSPRNNDDELEVGVMASMDYLPIAVAKERGYFDEEGVVVTIQKFFSANDRDAAIQSGSLDASILDYTGGAIQRAGGVELVFTSQCDATFELIAGKHVGIKTGSDLANKNFAVARNTVVDFCTDMALENAGITQNQVTKSEINKIPLRLEMLRNAKIDLTVLPDPFATIAKSDGNPAIISMKELGFQVTGIAFTQSAVNNKKKAIQAFYRAYNRAIEDLQNLPLSDFQDILTKEIGFPQALATNAKLPEYKEASLPQEKDLRAVSSWLKSKTLIPTDFDITSLISAEFIK
ncbi:MAG: ABC transporter substrate-binding protein [Paludibacteraceae bacterium]